MDRARELRVGALAVWLLACAKTPADDGTIALTGATCGPVQALRMAPTVPTDLVSSRDGNVLQRSADIFSWQSLIAVSWPAAAAGPSAWEGWKEEREVFLPDGAAPLAWGESPPSPPGCEGLRRTFVRTQKIDDVLDATLQAASTTAALDATLTDQHRQLVRYEIRMNQVAFDYIVARKLYDARVQAAAPSIAFPDGAVTLKAAWRSVTPDEEPRFQVVDACVCDIPLRRQGGAGGGERLRSEQGVVGDARSLAGCRPLRMGLVGVHLAQKTPSAPAWIWSTFEHVDNVPGDRAHAAGLSFNDPTCGACVPNVQTARGTPNQLTRELPIASGAPDCAAPNASADDVATLNADVARALTTAGSPLRFYQLVATQRPGPSAPGEPSTVFSVTPPVLANTTMESFVQRTSSCMGCHSTARTTRADGFVSADFVFSLNNALPVQPSSDVIAAPSAPATAWDTAHWPEVMLGLDLVAHTYERLPENAGAKLHCTSCHLDGGGNPSAAWWVNVRTTYPAAADLQARINHCFTNSLNGKVLCTPGSGCDANRSMVAIIAYMDWLAEQRPGKPVTGFPAIGTLVGDRDRGAATFVQKCAVCHGADGAGRYAGGDYYRPALWGPASFNKAAGMFASPAMLAAFLRWNMPRGAGGLLTDREAWDLQAYLDAQPRPGAASAKP